MTLLPILSCHRANKQPYSTKQERWHNWFTNQTCDRPSKGNMHLQPYEEHQKRDKLTLRTCCSNPGRLLQAQEIAQDVIALSPYWWKPQNSAHKHIKESSRRINSPLDPIDSIQEIHCSTRKSIDPTPCRADAAPTQEHHDSNIRTSRRKGAMCKKGPGLTDLHDVRLAGVGNCERG
jgi:hypothetical protein